jgi:hypothetical protein
MFKGEFNLGKFVLGLFQSRLQTNRLYNNISKLCICLSCGSGMGIKLKLLVDFIVVKAGMNIMPLKEYCSQVIHIIHGSDMEHMNKDLNAGPLL